MKEVIRDFLQLGSLRVVARLLMAARGLTIVYFLDPSALGDYTIWLLFIFYFSILDFGVLVNLERDLPHYQGSNDTQMLQKTTETGWSTYFLLIGIASLALFFASYVILKDFHLSVLLAFYLLTDKVYRGFESHSRIRFAFRNNGIAEMIVAVTSLIFICVFLPKFGPYWILIGFIIANVLGTFFFAKMSMMKFNWVMDAKKSFNCIRQAFSLAVIVYSIELFHSISLTILALQWDKETLGLYSFAFRIFYLCVAVFPYVIQEVMRTKIFYELGKAGDHRQQADQLVIPLWIYCLMTSLFWLTIYWWFKGIVNHLFPQYKVAVVSFRILLLALLPLGVSKVCGDYLCSYKKAKSMWVIGFWIVGILSQIFMLMIFKNANMKSILYLTPAIYFLATMLVFCLILGASFYDPGQFARIPSILAIMLFPLGAAVMTTEILRNGFRIIPNDFLNVDNVGPYLLSVLIWSGFIGLFVYLTRNFKEFKNFIKVKA